ncbi:MAG: hypothetical protein WCQ99_17805, partial [Pseudomonadota bacterium]
MLINDLKDYIKQHCGNISVGIAPVDDLSLTEVALFSVDSMLLRELGERLVGRPHIALAELVKNSYDADAT